MLKVRRGVTAIGWLALAASMLPAAEAATIESGVQGLKLVLLDKYGLGKAKAVYVAKNPGVGSHGAAGDPPGLTGTVEIFPLSDPTNRAVYDLPADWKVNKTNVAKYVNKTAGVGTLGAKVTVQKPGLVQKAVAKNLGDNDSASGDQSGTDLNLQALTTSDTIRVVLTIVNSNDGDTYVSCSDFDTLTIKLDSSNQPFKVLSRASTAPSSCGVAPPATTSSTTTSSTTTSSTTSSSTTSTLPALSHFWVYSWITPGEIFPPAVTIENQFIGPTSINSGVASWLFVPVDKNGEGIPNAFDHLSGHGFPNIPNPFSAVQIENQFGTQVLRSGVGGAYALLVPTEAFPEEGPPAPHQLDHFLCHHVLGDPLGLQVTLADQFQSASPTLGQAALLCAPADKNGEGVLNPVDHLVMYVHDPIGDAPGLVPIRNQFGSDSLVLGQPIALAVPSQKTFVSVCGNDTIEVGEGCEPSVGGCSVGEACQPPWCQCVTVPVEWTCLPQYYDTEDGCDCGCGVVDPDCADATVDSCEYCNDPGSCGVPGGPCPGNINPTDNSTCVAPAGWTCDPTLWNNNDGCNCGCGAADPDCSGPLVDSCDSCDDAGSCGSGPCPSNIYPLDNAVCSVPGWRCPPLYYGTDDGCDCGCGLVDPDCADATVDSCEFCTDLGSCGTGPCPSNIDPTDNSTCTVPAEWTCDSMWYAESLPICDCGCGAIDPDCQGIGVASCEFCNEEGSCSDATCPGDITSYYNAICTPLF